MTDATDIADTGDFEEFQDELKPGTQLLQGQYTIEKYLNSGGFAITYLARDSLDRQVVIKECFPGSFCRRSHALVQARSRAHQSEYKSIVRLFIQEARGLAKLSHPNIVGVHQVFEDNSTAYMALDLIKGRDLLDTLEDEKGQLKPSDVTNILKKLLGAIKYMHDQNVLHRDISPDNILLNEDLEPILIDFGAAREQASKVGKVLSALRVVKDGYSPQEFYVTGSIQGPSSDLYALGASFYHVITGEIPPDSQLRLASAAAREPDPYRQLHGNVKGYDDIFLMAIDKSLRLMPKDRLQSAGDWLAKIDQDEAVLAKPVEDNVSATVAQMMQQPDLSEPAQVEEPEAPVVPEAKVETPQPKAAEPTQTKAGKNRLDEIANEMASEEAEKKKATGKIVAGLAVAAALTGVILVTQTDLLSGGAQDGNGTDAISNVPAPDQSDATAVGPESDDSSTAVIAPDEPAQTDEIETADFQPVEVDDTPALEHSPDTGNTVDEPEIDATDGDEQGAVTVEAPETSTQPPETSSQPEVVEVEISSFSPVDFTAADVGLIEPEITEVAEVSLVLPHIQGLNISEPGKIPALPTDVASVDGVSFELEATGVAPITGLSNGQPLFDPSLDADLTLTTDQNLPNLPAIEKPSFETASLTVLEVLAPESGPAIVTEPIDLTSLIVPTTYLTTTWTAKLPFETRDGSAVTITQVNSGAAAWIKEGQVILSLNGETVTSNADIDRILQTAVGDSDAKSISAMFGIKDTNNAFTQQQAELSLLGKSALADGTTFETSFDSDAWKTTVAIVSGASVGEFVVGDIIVANVEAKQPITGRNTMTEIMNNGFSTGQDSLRFIVDRKGSNWFATVDISQVGGFQKPSLNSTNLGD